MEDTIQTLQKWNPWWGTTQVPEALRGIERENKLLLLKALDAKQIKDIIGIRRAGKTTLLYQVIDELLKAKINPRDIIFIRFDDPGISKISLEQLETVLYQISPQPQYLFLDEIQEKKGWEKWVKTIYDLQRFKQIFITGSSTALLSKELGTLLTGRHLSFQLMPFSFREYLLVQGWTNFNPSYLSAEKGKVLYHLNQYLTQSGFPEAIVHEKSLTKTILTGIYNDIIFSCKKPFWYSA